MAQIIKLKRKSSAAGYPTASQISLGEPAVNTATGNLYFKDDNGIIIDISAIIIDVTVSSSEYYFNGVRPDSLVLQKGQKYIFRQTDSSNSTHNLIFTTGESRTSGTITTGIDSSQANSLEYTVPLDAPDGMYANCQNHDNMGLPVLFGGGGGGASVTVADNAPSSPESGDMWFDSSSIALLVYYEDGDNGQWIDISASSAASSSSTMISTGDTSVSTADTGTDGNIAFETEGSTRWKITSGGHIIPEVNAAYDLGNAEYKVRHLFLSDNSLWIGDQHKMDIESGKIKFRKRKTDKVPTSILEQHESKDEASHGVDALVYSGKESLTEMKLENWIDYAQSLGGSLANADVNDLFPASSSYKDDYEEISSPATSGQDKISPIVGDSVLTLDLKEGNTLLVKEPTENINLSITGSLATSSDPEGSFFEATIHVKQGASPKTLDLTSITIDGQNLPASNQNFSNTPNLQANKLSTFKISAVFIDGVWEASILGYPQ